MRVASATVSSPMKFLRFQKTIALQRFYLSDLKTLTCLSTERKYYIKFSAAWIVADTMFAG